MPTRTTTCRFDAKSGRKTKEGYALHKVNPTRIGVFDYWDPETQKIRRELRPPEEVTNPVSLATLNHKIVTDDHPPVMLDLENTPIYNRGHMTMDHVMDEDGIHTLSELCITHPKLMKKIDDGKEQVSCGYECDIEETSGEWTDPLGVKIKYDCIQRNIRYNHLAIVKRGRAKTAALRADRLSSGLKTAFSVKRFDAYQMDGDDIDIDEDENPNDSENKKTHSEQKKDNKDKKLKGYVKYMPDYRFDGETYDVSEGALAMLKVRDKAEAKERTDAEKALKTAEDEAKQARKDAEEAKKQADKEMGELRVKLDQANEEIEKLKDIDARVDEREDIKSKASAILGKDYKTKGKTDEQIKMDILEKAIPNFKAKLDSVPKDQQPIYIQGRFDGIVEGIKPTSVQSKGRAMTQAVNHVDADSFDDDGFGGEYFDNELNDDKEGE